MHDKIAKDSAYHTLNKMFPEEMKLLDSTIKETLTGLRFEKASISRKIAKYSENLSNLKKGTPQYNKVFKSIRDLNRQRWLKDARINRHLDYQKWLFGN